MAFQHVSEVLKAFENLKVLIIGDVMIDAYIYGTVKRISPEAPVPIVSVTRREKRLGGAANVAMNIQSLGATPVLCSVTGNDPEGDEFIEILGQQKMTAMGIIKSPDRITTVKNRVISSSQHLLRIDSESEAMLSNAEQLAFIDKLEELIPECDLVIFEDYDKGVLNPEVISKVIQLALKKGIPTAVDPKKINFKSYQGCTLFKPNLKELREGLGIDIDPKSIEQVEKAVIALKKQLHFDQAIITLSEYGVYYHSDNQSGVLPAHLRSIADVSGAGDTVISIAAMAMALNVPLPFTSELANLGGGIVCEYQGVVPIDKQQLENEASKSGFLKNFS